MKEHYQVLSRKYRPKNFFEVIGQEAVVTTLQNAVRLNKTAQAYLFAGTRGTGKTTLARLFAKALNCLHLNENIEPCNQCVCCREIGSSSSLDTIEIDGASNRGIDDIRQINETIGYAPSAGKYKIYIIDEVHMLTKEAFNALLKTLEEPPSNVKFFFATTEPHKVPPTVISRCQRFHLQRLTQKQIIQKLSSILVELQRSVDEDAVCFLSHLADGSLRDAESLLDQILCQEEGTVTLSSLKKMFGYLSQEHFFYLDKAVSENNTSFAFDFVQKALQNASDPLRILEELLEHFRHLLLIKMDKESQSFLSSSLIQKYKKSALIYSEDQLFFLIDLLLKSFSSLEKTAFAQVHLEAILLKIIKSSHMLPLPTLIRKLQELKTNESSQPPLENQPIKKGFPSTQTVEEKPVKKPPKQIKKHSSDYDTLLCFTAVELQGTIEKEIH